LDRCHLYLAICFSALNKTMAIKDVHIWILTIIIPDNLGGSLTLKLTHEFVHLPSCSTVWPEILKLPFCYGIFVIQIAHVKFNPQKFV